MTKCDAALFVSWFSFKKQNESGRLAQLGYSISVFQQTDTMLPLLDFIQNYPVSHNIHLLFIYYNNNNTKLN